MLVKLVGRINFMLILGTCACLPRSHEFTALHIFVFSFFPRRSKKLCEKSLKKGCADHEVFARGCLAAKCIFFAIFRPAER